MAEKEKEETSYRMEGIAFGLADGTILCLGLTIGVAKATSNTNLVIISGIIGGIANAFGNSIGLFMSQSAERGLQIHETVEHGVSTRIHSKMEVLTSSVLSFMATIVALIILLFPFAFLNMTDAVLTTFSFGTILSFILGNYVGKLSGENPYKTGLKYAVLAIVGAVISFLVGDLLRLLI
jgi:predicted membrane protein (TIGR00267 family)